MKPHLLILGASLLAIAAAELLALARRDPTDAPAPAPTPVPTAAAAPALLCPADTLPDDGACIPVPRVEQEPPEALNQLELLPGRSEDYARYLTPIAAYPARAAPEGLGVSIAAPRGTVVTAISLESQAGPTRRVVTPGPRPRLLTLHHVERHGAARTYLLSYDGSSFDPTPGTIDVDVGTPLGQIKAGPGVTGLLLAVRQLRRGVDADRVSPERLLRDSHSLACDARNVLPLKPAR